MEVLFFETNHDGATKQVYTARRNVFHKMGALGEFHLFGSAASASNLLGLTKSSWQLFSGLGHGHPDEFRGYNDQPVANVADAPGTSARFSEKFVHLYSCNTAKLLGPEMIKWAAKAFIGYNDYVTLASTAALEEQFIALSKEVDRSILAGDNHTVTKTKADAEYQRVRALLTAPVSSATPGDVAAFDLN